MVPSLMLKPFAHYWQMTHLTNWTVFIFITTQQYRTRALSHTHTLSLSSESTQRNAEQKETLRTHSKHIAGLISKQMHDRKNSSISAYVPENKMHFVLSFIWFSITNLCVFSQFYFIVCLAKKNRWCIPLFFDNKLK